MTTATVRMNKSDLMAPPVAQTIQQRSLVIGAIAAVVSVAGAFLAPGSFYSAYLIGFMFWLGLSLGCMAILMLHHLVGGAWGTVVRRILESGMMTLPLMFVLFIPILLPYRSTISKTDCAVILWPVMRSPLLTGRNSRPPVIPAAATH